MTLFGAAINTDIKHIPLGLSMQKLYRQLREGHNYSPDHPPVDVQIRAWFNPYLVTANHVVPGLI